MTRKRQTKVAALAAGSGILLLSTSCAIVRQNGKVLDRRTRTVSLSAVEAACLVAEAMSFEFTAVNRDPLRPLARAFSRGDGVFEICYASGSRGPHRPRSNGFFVRVRPSDSLANDDVPIPDNPLGVIRFRPATRLALPSGPSVHRFLAVVTPRDETSCDVQLTSGDDGAWATARLDKLERLLEMAASLKAGMARARSGETAGAIGALTATLKRYRSGFSAIHDPMLGQAYTLLARLEEMRGDPRAASRALARASLLLPDSASLAMLRSRLGDRLALPERSHTVLAHAANVASPGGARAKAVSIAAGRSRRAVTGTVQSALDRSAEALAAGDPISATAWANRALDQSPGHPRALRSLARSLTRTGNHVESRSCRLQSMQDGKPAATTILRLATDEAECGDPALALRWVLRHAAVHPELLESRRLRSLVRRLGWRRAVRMVRTEDLGPAGLDLALDWIIEADARDSFAARLLVRTAHDALPLPAPRSTATRAQASHFGASGVQVDAPAATPPR